MALVAYGSGSETDSDNDNEGQKANMEVNQSPEKPTHKALNLPSVSGAVHKPEAVEEQELEGVVKPRDWEQQLAAKNKRKLEKRAHKKEKKDKKHKKSKKEDKGERQSEIKKKPTTKIKIQAFGALEALQSDSDEEEEAPKAAAPRPIISGGTSSLLSMLPAPKTKAKSSGIFGQRSSDTSSLFLPSTLKKTQPKPTSVPKPTITPSTSTMSNKRNANHLVEEDSDDDSDGDYFGLNSAPEPKTIRMNTDTDAPATWIGPGHFGPEKPQQQQEMHPSQMYNYVDEQSQLPQRPTKAINDEQAYNLISRDETVQVNDRRTLNEITAGIIDFNVDKALGSNVQSELLKGVTKAAYLRDVQSLPTKKDTVERVARQKHQITYLAKLAVARDEALQDQWAASKNNKRMARQKYGF